jgi:hypothetical protein
MGRSATRQLQSGPEDPKDLIPILPYCCSARAKFCGMPGKLEGASFPYENITPVFAENGDDGYVNSEYEGKYLDAYGTSGASLRTGTAVVVFAAAHSFECPKPLSTRFQHDGADSSFRAGVDAHATADARAHQPFFRDGTRPGYLTPPFSSV